MSVVKKTESLENNINGCFESDVSSIYSEQSRALKIYTFINYIIYDWIHLKWNGYSIPKSPIILDFEYVIFPLKWFDNFFLNFLFHQTCINVAICKIPAKILTLKSIFSNVIITQRGTGMPRVLGVRNDLNNYFAMYKCLTRSRIRVELASPAYSGLRII